MNLGPVEVVRKTGEETLCKGLTSTGIKLNEFWSWSSSDIINNSLRGVFAEFIVASDLKITKGNRVEWDAYDLLLDDKIKIEVKSSSYIQSWGQVKHSNISFKINLTIPDNTVSNMHSQERKRQSDVYVFCLLAHKDQDTVNPLNMEQWEFYVLNTEVLNEKLPKQKTIVLNSLLKLNPIKCEYGNIREAIYNTL
ncbi:hypothetical protein [Clostridium estertheticum]|uniref:hypothetical protein n=1 Tax=Clostridium estertheticum TaxID=238834 RepID=UPI001C0B55FC|nr:hypothetical protein [Clostridium estertheticum]MBU3072539.1 hypothetical protein [Clostridium estertheticum]MBU3162632.1 hypothetical protein [Clostridium estertheticum]